ncbi:MAG: 5-formyltetrahydrofolate cyclo-ligase [Gammaproteobacteria bacterium]|nr:5-formyltetrahydrofolate cyclo-ligase [Gammaproteobacteria bacterium]
MYAKVVNLRIELRSARRGLSAEQQEEHALAVSAHLLCSNVFSSATCVAVYFSSDGEVDLAPVIEKLHSDGIKLVAPRIEGLEMAFFPFNPSDTLLENQWGIKEPEVGISIEEAEMSVALVPLVAFTEDGDRLGRGKGFYDRYFTVGDTLLIGIGHEIQRVDSIERNTWDRRLDAVVTEKGWDICSSRAAACIQHACGDSK